MRSKKADAERESLEAFWQGQLEDEKKQSKKTDPVWQRFKLVEFISRREWGKRRKRPKQVTLLVISHEGADDLNAKKHKKKRSADSHAEWALLERGEHPETGAVERIIEILRGRG